MREREIYTGGKFSRIKEGFRAAEGATLSNNRISTRNFPRAKRTTRMRQMRQPLPAVVVLFKKIDHRHCVNSRLSSQKQL